MSGRTAIAWTDTTWNPVTGCTRVSAGCDHCYAARQAATRLKHRPQYRDLATITPSGRAAFNGTIRLLPERLEQPIHWRTRRRVFVNSMSDLFHEGVPDDYIAQVFGVMARASRHTFQVLTKRPDRMRDWFRWIEREDANVAGNLRDESPWPLPNVWLGVSTEDQATADERIPLLLETPAAVRFISAEPLLGPIDLDRLHGSYRHENGAREDWWVSALSGKRFDIWADGDVPAPRLDWVIVGGESGPHHRPMDFAWARRLREQCAAAGVPFFFKQVGGRTSKAGGDLLDGREHKEFPA